MTSLWASPSPKKTKPNNVSSCEFHFATSPENHAPNNIKEIASSMERSHKFEFNSLDEAVDF
eukprot:5389178-Ditylum_brightwellii.AAC.1